MTSSHKLPSNQSFGLLFTSICLGLSGYGLLMRWEKISSINWHYWDQVNFSMLNDLGIIGPVSFLVVGTIIGLVTIFFPGCLTPFNKAWFLLGLILAKIVNPIVMGGIFFGLLAPIAVIVRWKGRDELRLKRKQVDSYWIRREPPGPASNSFKNQF